MAAWPGRHYVNDLVRIETNFQNVDGTALDPTTVTLLTMSPSGTETTYTYADGEVTRESAGVYYYDLTPDESGRWAWRWQTTGSGTTMAYEGSIVVQYSPFFDDVRDAYR